MTVPYLRPEDFQSPTDVCWADACAKAMASVRDPSNPARGGRLVFSARTYNFTRPLEVTRCWVLEGAGGGWGHAAATVLTFPAGGNGLVIQAHNASLDDPDGGGADWSVVRDLSIVCSPNTDPHGDGVLMRGRARIENVFISGFGRDGIHIESQVNVSNMNGWYLGWVSITGTGRCGLYIDGADTNAGLSLGLNIKKTGRLSHLFPNDQSAGIYDSSFLGSTHIAPIAHTIQDAKGAGLPPYYSSSNNASTVYLNPYAESNSGLALFDRPSTRIAGICKADPKSTGTNLPADNALLRSGASDSTAVWLNTEATAKLYVGRHRVRVGYGIATPPIPDATWPVGSEWNVEFPTPGQVDRYRLCQEKSGLRWVPCGTLGA